MKVVSSLSAAALALGLAAPASAQYTSQPVHWAPVSTGVTIQGQIGAGLNEDAEAVPGEKPLAYGGQVTLGLSMFMVSAGFSIWDPRGATTDTESNFGGSVGVNLPLPPTTPVSVTVAAGAGFLSLTGGDVITIPAGVSIAYHAETPTVSVTPWIAPRAHIERTSPDIGDSSTDVGFGVSGGLKVELPMGLGFFAAGDWLTIKPEGATESVKPFVIGGGVSYRIQIPSLSGGGM